MTDVPARRIDEISAESRRRILDAAEELFAEKGFDRTSFVELAARSGISRGSITWHFQNKDGLLLAVVRRSLDRELAKGSFTETSSFRSVITQIGAAGGGPILFMLLIEAMSTEGLIHDQYVEFFRTRRDALGDFMRRSDAPGLPSELRDRKALANVISATLLGLQFLSTLDPDDVDLKRSLNQLAQVVEAATGWT